MPFYGQPPGLKDLLRTVSDKQENDRQVGVPIATIAGNGNGDPDMRKLYSDELQSSMMTTDGPKGVRSSFITNIIGNQTAIPGDPMLKNHTSTSNIGGTVTQLPNDNPSSTHSESELVASCDHMNPPDGASFPWVYYHTIGSGFAPGYYYFLSPTDGPHPGRGPGWPS